MRNLARLALLLLLLALPARGDTTATCPIAGPPDLKANRDDAIPRRRTPFLAVRLQVNVLANDDGSAPCATPDEVKALLRQLDSDFKASRIRFVAKTTTVRSTRFCHPQSFADVAAMRADTATSPERCLNVFIVDLGGSGLFGMGTFPWDSDALGSDGGLLLGRAIFGARWSELHAVVTHEIGHCFGLWHTFRGVSEVEGCDNACRELAGVPDQDAVGDYCSDTPPEPLNHGCASVPGADCNGAAWGQTDFTNWMGYHAPCATHFTPQQAGRMRAWLGYALAGWLVASPYRPH